MISVNMKSNGIDLTIRFINSKQLKLFLFMYYKYMSLFTKESGKRIIINCDLVTKSRLHILKSR